MLAIQKFIFKFAEVPGFVGTGDGAWALRFATPLRTYGPAEQQRREARKAFLSDQAAELLREGGRP